MTSRDNRGAVRQCSRLS